MTILREEIMLCRSDKHVAGSPAECLVPVSGRYSGRCSKISAQVSVFPGQRYHALSADKVLHIQPSAHRAPGVYKKYHNNKQGVDCH